MGIMHAGTVEHQAQTSGAIMEILMIAQPTQVINHGPTHIRQTASVMPGTLETLAGATRGKNFL
jgi:hypothetical protein